MCYPLKKITLIVFIGFKKNIIKIIQLNNHFVFFQNINQIKVTIEKHFKFNIYLLTFGINQNK